MDLLLQRQGSNVKYNNQNHSFRSQVEPFFGMNNTKASSVYFPLTFQNLIEITSLKSLN